ncbi:MAG: hypothetical protein HKP30_06380, partial [Myxococcales bacterium]|nr:hypothetical protein [Myxococcales bacterium]
MSAPAGRARGILVALVAACAIAWLGFELRAVSAPLVLRPDAVRFPADADELYHVRRIVHAALHFPDFITTDRYVNHPAGSQIIWPPGFDFGVAAAIRLLAAPETAAEVERAAVWAPPAIGAFTIALVVLAAWFAFAPAAGVAAGLLLALLPAHFTNSQIGLVDHHVAAAAFAAAIVSAALALLRSASPVARTASVLALGVALAGAHWVWVGALFHAFLVAAVLVLWMALAGSREAALRAATDLAAAHAIACLGTLAFVAVPVWPDYGPWSPIVTSRLQPTWFGAAAFALG